MCGKILSSEIQEFLSKKGSIGLIVQIDKEDGNIQSDLRGLLHINRRTLRVRIQKAEEVGLLETDRNPEDHGSATRYVLSTNGRFLRELFEFHDIDVYYKEFIRAQRELSSHPKKILSWYDELLTKLQEMDTGEKITRDDISEAANRIGHSIESDNISDTFVTSVNLANTNHYDRKYEGYR